MLVVSSPEKERYQISKVHVKPKAKKMSSSDGVSSSNITSSPTTKTNSSSSSQTKQQKIQNRLNPDTTIKIVYRDTSSGTATNDDNNDRSSSNDVELSSQLDTTNVEPKYIIGYWSIRGLGAPIRMLLNALEVNHWTIYYDVLEEEDDENESGSSGNAGGGWNKQSWYNDKAWLINEYNPFINLPFLVDVEKQIVISQTNAILTYLNRQEIAHRVVQQPAVVTKQAFAQQQQQEEEQVKVEELLCEIMDLRNQMVRFAYGKRKRVTSTAVVAAAVAATTTTITSSNHYDEVDKVDAKLLLQSIQPILTKFQLHFEQRQQQLQKQQQEQQQEQQQLNSSHFLVGNTYTVADFHLWEMLDQYINLIQYYKLDETDNDDNNDNGNNDDASLLSSLLLLSPPPSSIAGQKSKNLLYNFYTNFKQLPENQSSYEFKIITNL